MESGNGNEREKEQVVSEPSKVVSSKCLPTYYPIGATAWAWLLTCHLYAPPGWVCGVVWTLVAWLWIAVIIIRRQAEYVDIFKGGK